MKALIKALDGRGWIGLASFGLTAFIISLLAGDPDLRKDDFFQSIAILLIGTSWVNGVVSWAYAATQNGGDLATRNADVVQKITEKTTAGIQGGVQEVEVVNPPSSPVPTEDTGANNSISSEELPPYAR